MFTLRLFIMGLVALVPENGGVTLVLPNVSVSCEEHPHTVGCVEHPHFALLSCDPYQAECNVLDIQQDADVRGTDQWPDIRKRLNLDNTARGKGFLLAGEEVAIRGALPGELRFEAGEWHRKWWWDDFFGARPDELDAADDMTWVPELAHADSDAAVIDSRHLQAPSKNSVAALQALRGLAGEAYGYNFPALRTPRRALVRSLTFRRANSCKPTPTPLSALTSKPCQWWQRLLEWLPPVKTLRHAAPDVLLVEIPFSGPSIRLELRGFSDAEPRRALSLTPKAGQRVVDVLLGNLTPLPDDQLPREKVGDPVGHFDLYYKLSESPPEKREQKVPHIGDRKADATKIERAIPSVVHQASRPKGGVGGLERPFCTSTQLKKSPGLVGSAAEGNAAMPSSSLAAAASAVNGAARVTVPLGDVLFAKTTDGTTRGWTFTASTQLKETPGLVSSAAEGKAAVQAVLRQQRPTRLAARHVALPLGDALLAPFFENGTGKTFRYRAKTAEGKETESTFTALEDQAVVVWRGTAPRPEVLEKAPQKGPVFQSSDPAETPWSAAVFDREVLEEFLRANTVAVGSLLPDVAALPAFLDDEGKVRFLVPLIRLWLHSGQEPAAMGITKAEVLRSGIPGYFSLSVDPLDLFDTIDQLRQSDRIIIAEPGELGLGRMPTQAFDSTDCTKWGRDKIRAVQAGTEGANVVVAVIDTGVDHPDLRRDERLVDRNGEDWDFSEPHSEVPHDEHGHGNHVAGIIADVARKASILPLRVNLGSASDDDYVRAIHYVAERAKIDQENRYVLNMSWTLGTDKGCVREALKNAIKVKGGGGEERGVVAVAAAGNGTSDLAFSPEYPAVYAKPPESSDESDESEEPEFLDMLTVAAIQDNDVKTIDSSYGKAVSVSAPGWGIFSEWKDGGHRCGDGTSMAAAHVSGLAALVLSKHLEEPPAVIRDKIKNGSIDISKANPKLKGKLGKGRVDAPSAVR